MANLTESSVVVNRGFFLGGLQNKDYVKKHVTLTLAGHGSATSGSQIPAAALGFVFILEAGNFVKADNSVIYNASPSADGSILLLDSVGTTAGVPDAVTGTLTGTVMGSPLAQY